MSDVYEFLGGVRVPPIQLLAAERLFQAAAAEWFLVCRVILVDLFTSNVGCVMI